MSIRWVKIYTTDITDDKFIPMHDMDRTATDQ